MIYAIETHMLDVLQADATLYAGGSAWPAGWFGSVRTSEAAAPQAGWVNLFDGSYEPAGGDHRPAVYLGTEQIEAYDRLEQPTIAQGAWQELRIATIVLVVAAAAPSKQQARQQRDQLRANIRAILNRHIAEPGYWYDARMGEGGGQMQEQLRVTAVGSGAQRIAEASAILPVTVRYVWSSTAQA